MLTSFRNLFAPMTLCSQQGWSVLNVTTTWENSMQHSPGTIKYRSVYRRLASQEKAAGFVGGWAGLSVSAPVNPDK